MNIIHFDEFMTNDGKWGVSQIPYKHDLKNIVKLNYKSDEYDYFLYTFSHGTQILLRNQKRGL